MGLRLPNLDYYTMLSGIGDSPANAYDKHQAPKLLAEAMASRAGHADFCICGYPRRTACACHRRPPSAGDGAIANQQLETRRLTNCSARERMSYP